MTARCFRKQNPKFFPSIADIYSSILSFRFIGRLLIISSPILLFLSIPLFGQAAGPRLVISHVTGGCYVYTTSRMLDGILIPANSMYIVTDSGTVMIDTPWDTTQFLPLLDSIRIRHRSNVVLCLATHFHSDRTAGLDFLKQKRIPTFSSKLTFDLCQERHEKQAAYFFTKDTTFLVGGHRFFAYYPGEGHTKDNIVVWCDDEKLLYGGCLVKSSDAGDLGNLADANTAEWQASIMNVIHHFPEARFVIPGHFGWKDKRGLEHTLKLLEDYKKQSSNSH
ncbi:MAG TPA: subclass B1 metallo-beta-lactamase [Bacteroidota bacterium]|nr:subclass B1 metallo-beta-lactamase [Bacteroidota bacterium]